MDANHDEKENDIVRAVLQDFYISLYPKRSKFELNSQYRNRFLHVDELKNWQKDRDFIYFILFIILIFIGLSAFYLTFQNEVIINIIIIIESHAKTP